MCLHFNVCLCGHICAYMPVCEHVCVVLSVTISMRLSTVCLVLYIVPVCDLCMHTYVYVCVCACIRVYDYVLCSCTHICKHACVCSVSVTSTREDTYAGAVRRQRVNDHSSYLEHSCQDIASHEWRSEDRVTQVHGVNHKQEEGGARDHQKHQDHGSL